MEVTEPSVFRDGNGSVKLLRLITLVGATAAAVIAIVTIMWQLFSIAANVSGQVQKNDEFLRRISVIEASIQSHQVLINGHELRIVALRSDFDSQRTSDIGFQTRMQASIDHVTELLTTVRLLVGSGQGRNK